MQQESLSVLLWQSGHAKNLGIIVSLRRSSTDECEAVIGYPGVPNVKQTLRNGDTVLMETPLSGVIEVRAIAIYPSRAEFLLTQVSPQSGFAAGAFDSDPNNSPFSEVELLRISKSIAAVKADLARQGKLLPEQLSLVTRKLDEIESASRRLGRKDWINYVAGAMTSVCISAAFAPDAARHVFLAINTAFSWLFAGGALLLQRM